MSYVQLTLYERFAIYQFHVAQFGVREIARRLNRHHSTISRELKRSPSASLAPFAIPPDSAKGYPTVR